MRHPHANAGLLTSDVSLPRALYAGAIAGAIGGAMMAAWASVLAAVTGFGLFFPFRLVGATLMGDRALVGGSGVLIYGLALHVFISIAFGALFGVMTRQTSSRSSALTAGVLYGLGLLLLMNYLVLPLANPIILERMVLVPGSWFFMHIFYGAGVALAPEIRRKLSAAAPGDLSPAAAPT